MFSRHEPPLPPASSSPPNFSSSASSKVMKYCPAAAVITIPALEHSLINWKWSGRFANFRLSSCSKFPCRVSLVRGVSFVVDKSVGITTVSELSSATSLLVLSKTARDPPSQLVTHVRYCSVDTELIDGNNCAKNNFCCFSITTEIHRQCSSSFAWQRSSYKTLGPRNAFSWTILNQRVRRLSLWTTELPGRWTKSSFSMIFLANRSRIFCEFRSVHWPISWLHRTIGSLFFVTDFWLNVNSPNIQCSNELLLAGRPT